MKERDFDKELKKAAHEVCLSMATWDASPAVPYKLSSRFTSNLQATLVAAEGRRKRKRMLRRIAAHVYVRLRFQQQ